MARLVCGRCGNYAAQNSTYCPTCRWALFADVPGRGGEATLDLEFPPGSAGMMARRKQAGHRDHLEKAYRDNLERRMDALEKRMESEPDNFEVLSVMGTLAMLDDQWERAGALLERANALAPDDMPASVNFAITQARRGQLQPALSLLESARQKHPDIPLVLINQALVALQARRPLVVHDAVDALEKLWFDNATIAQQFHDEAITTRGLALLLQSKPKEAFVQLDAAARHAVNLHRNESRLEDIGDGMQIEHAAVGEESGEMILEGKTAQAESLANLALAEAGMGDLDKATARLKAALRLDPGHPRILGNLGVLAYRQGKINLAYRYLDLTRQMEEELGRVDPVTWNHLGVVYSALGELDRSLESFQRAGGSEHAEVEVYYNLGRAFIEFGKADAGVGYLRQAFQIDPNNADIHTVLGAAYIYSGKVNLYAEAFKHLKRALQIDSHHKSAAINLILALADIKNFDAARNLLKQALQLFPKEAEPHYVAALLILENITESKTNENFWAGASQQFELAFNSRPDIVGTLYNSALCQFLMGFRDTSSKLLEAAVARDNSIGPAYYLIGLGHAVAKRDLEAIAAWKIAIQLEADNPDLHANLGALLYRRGDFQGSIRSYMNAHRLAPQDPTILAALGVAFAQAKMFNQAITSLEQSIQIDSRSPVAQSNLGLAYYLFKQVEKAMFHWRIVSQLDSKYAAAREEEQQRSFDDSIIQLRPLSWRDRLIRMAPTLPRPHTRLLPATDTRAYYPVITDPALQQILLDKREVERASRLLTWMSIKA